MTTNDEMAVPPENIGFLNFATISLSAVKGHKPCTLLQASRHNLREIQAELGANGRINARRMGDNVILVGPATAADVVVAADKIMAQLEKPPTRRDAVQAVEAVFSLNRKTSIDVAAFFTRCLDWVAMETQLPVLLATIHQDEEHPHLHVLLAPVKDGAYVGGSLTVKAEQNRMRDLFGKRVATPAGLKHGGAKFRGQVKKWAISAVLRKCEAMGLPAATGVLWGMLRAAIERDPTEAMGRLKIDVNSIRPSAETSDIKPIGIDAKPIGIDLDPLKSQSLSCVGIGSPAPPTEATKAPQATPPTVALQDVGGGIGFHEHTNDVATSTSTTTPAPAPAPAPAPILLTVRLSKARAAQQSAIAKHCKHADRKAAPVTDSDGYTRDRGDAHDLSAWD